jgi:hypothetical protein
VKKRAIRKFPYTIHADSGLPNKITTQIRTYIWMALVRQCCTGRLPSYAAGRLDSAFVISCRVRQNRECLLRRSYSGTKVSTAGVKLKNQL